MPTPKKRSLKKSSKKPAAKKSASAKRPRRSTRMKVPSKGSVSPLDRILREARIRNFDTRLPALTQQLVEEELPAQRALLGKELVSLVRDWQGELQKRMTALEASVAAYGREAGDPIDDEGVPMVAMPDGTIRFAPFTV